jgi:hypothetical protein
MRLQLMISEYKYYLFRQSQRFERIASFPNWKSLYEQWLDKCGAQEYESKSDKHKKPTHG